MRVADKEIYLAKKTKHKEISALTEKKLIEQGFEISDYLSEFKFSKLKSTREQEWLNQHNPLNPYNPEKRIHVTHGGVKLCSKSERIIGTFLETKNIPYKSDELLVVGGNEWYPDFKIRRPRDGKIIIWEHFGMMDDKGYAERNQEKLIIYMEYGFRLLENLIVTHDENGTIDMVTLEKLYQLVLK